MIHRDNAEVVVQQLMSSELYVIQKYVERPLLWHKKKFHFRCYAIVTADLRAYLYQNAFILTASQDYCKSNDDTFTHITNLAVNKVRVFARRR